MRISPLTGDGAATDLGTFGGDGAAPADPRGENSERQLRPDGQDHLLRVLACLGIFAAALAWWAARDTDASAPLAVLGGATAITCLLTLVLNFYICWVARNWWECAACEDTGLYPPGLSYDASGRVVIPTACSCGRRRELGAADMDAIMRELRMRAD